MSRPRRTLAILALLAAPLATAAASTAAPDWAVAIFPSGAEFTVELRSDPVERARGYMFREEVGPAEGMLFLFPTSGRHSFWMKNCLVDLDIVWLDENLRVVDIALGQTPCRDGDDCPSVLPASPARVVLEVAAGRIEEEGLAVGDRLIVLPELTLPTSDPH